jgi:hypothetical protein
MKTKLWIILSVFLFSLPLMAQKEEDDNKTYEFRAVVAHPLITLYGDKERFSSK